uniref:Uncharacterized protein n=1 Tax=Anguilla anguilla TaxID=7936 RepID=A0A0E9Y095_ANGAN
MFENMQRQTNLKPRFHRRNYTPELGTF